MPDAKDNHGRSNTSNMLTKPAVDIAPEPVPADLGSWSVYTAQGIMVVSVHAGVTPLPCGSHQRTSKHSEHASGFRQVCEKGKSFYYG